MRKTGDSRFLPFGYAQGRNDDQKSKSKSDVQNSIAALFEPTHTVSSRPEVAFFAAVAERPACCRARRKMFVARFASRPACCRARCKMFVARFASRPACCRARCKMFVARFASRAAVCPERRHFSKQAAGLSTPHDQKLSCSGRDDTVGGIQKTHFRSVACLVVLADFFLVFACDEESCGVEAAEEALGAVSAGCGVVLGMNGCGSVGEVFCQGG